jgi:uroporphyrinogen III methyltransferase/synthase
VAEGPLAGRRIVVTRPRAQAAPLAEALEALGATAPVLPLIEIETADGLRGMDLEGYDWIVFTSANAVPALPSLQRGAGRRPRIAAVGPATADAIRSAGAEPAFVPERFAAEEIADGLEPLRGRRVLLPQADIADPGLADELRARGAATDAVVAYRTVELELPPERLEEARTADAIVLASGSAARSLARQGGSGRALVVSIGPKTAQAARDAGLPDGLVAREATAEGIIQALTSHFGESR